MGFFGYSTSGKKDESPQPRHRARVDIRQAISASEVLMGFWRETRKHPDAPPLSGGVLDAWPAYLVDALAIADEEFQVVCGFMNHEAPRG